MGTLKEVNPNARELLTEILDKTEWWNVLRIIVELLRSKKVEQVRMEFGFVLDRGVAGKPQAEDQIVQLGDLEAAIKRGFIEGRIEWASSSEFLFHPLGVNLSFMLCNDADLHFASTDFPLLMELANKIRSSGIKIYDGGKLI